jgi:hypothetical protein
MSAKGRNKEVVRRIKKASQAKYAEKLFLTGTPRAEDVGRALLNALRNHHARIVNTGEEKRVIAILLGAAVDALAKDGFSKARVVEKIAKLLAAPKPLSMPEIEEHARFQAEVKKASAERKTSSISEALRLAGVDD